MAITSTGIGSGIDVGGIVSQLVAAEGQPARNRLDRREAQTQATISALGGLKGALSEFQSALGALKDLDAFQARKATSGDSSIFTATADETASAGSYQIEVERLAEGQKLRSGDFANADTVVGTGTLTLDVGGNSFDVTVDSSNNTLAGIRDAINASADNTGVTATTVNVDDGAGGTVSRLVLTADEVGTANTVTVSAADSDGNNIDAAGLSQLASGNLTELQAAQDALIRIDGQAVTRSSNSISDAIDGVTLSLKESDVGSTHSLDVALNTGAVKSKVESFVKAYNGLVETTNQLSSYDPETGRAGALQGDAALRGISTQIRREMSDTVDGINGVFDNLATIGVETQRDGTLTLDSARLDEAMAADFDAIGQMFASDDGYATRLDALVDNYVGFNGILDSRTQSLNNRIDDIGDQREDLSRRLSSLESRLLAEFNAMDQLVGQLNSTGSYLSQQLSNLPFNNLAGGNQK
ncbi:MAG: flagellar filament capping protein FliD [Halothiobacillaceae bacterium]|nr:flagellar filament capping protein FliD [Halothiobacillaceae bacterium]HER33955.1 flagellar cap protein [Halothiobacillaceae bacterium]